MNYSSIGMSIVTLQHAVESIQRDYNALTASHISNDGCLAGIAYDAERAAKLADKVNQLAKCNMEELK
jgi:hypothetical protein